MARPSKFSTRVEKAILDALRRGNTRTAAFEAAGVHRSKISVWLARFATFRDAVEKAEAEAEIKAVGNVSDAADGGTWQASAWWLERRRHQDWGKVDRIELEVRQAAERVAAATGADPSWLIRRAQEIAAAARVEQAP
jgi:hypothetical protein